MELERIQDLSIELQLLLDELPRFDGYYYRSKGHKFHIIWQLVSGEFDGRN